MFYKQYHYFYKKSIDWKLNLLSPIFKAPAKVYRNITLKKLPRDVISACFTKKFTVTTSPVMVKYNPV